jgi:hypothetical protein
MADGSDEAKDSLQREFIQIICDLGSHYDYICLHEENTKTAIRCAELQLRFLISSSVYERDGLFGTFVRNGA